ncbi:hypothetical protein CSA37_07660 [Candidatus Fermentibacteria bacterium]|nr:MAG: hypothetical protein CSA37_07660 [Candidatus Fermentibacteria bacterium]
MGAVPRSVHGSAGVCPARGITISAGASFHQYAGAEYSAVTSVEPFPGFVIAVSVLTPPARIGFSIQASVHNTALQYGYSTHPVLPAGHSVGVTYGTSGFRPSALVSYVSSDPSSVEFPVNLNTASDTQLVQIPGIGPSTASLIINYRNEHGLFQSVEQLLDVPGIGNATLESLKPYLTI